MKQKINVLLLFLSLTLTLSAGQWFTLTHLSVKVGDERWSKEEQLYPPLQMYSDPDRKRITVYSPTIQIFDYVHLESLTYADGKILIGWATDTEYRRIRIAIVTLNGGQEFFTVIYRDVEYMYTILKE